MKVYNSTLVYIEKDGKYLMLHRNKKEGDISKGKWIGVGGKFELMESPEECMEREVMEETGLDVLGYVYCGIITFIFENTETEEKEVEYIHLFKVTNFTGEIKDCNEGELSWIAKDKILEIPHWTGDELFLSLIRDGRRPFFSTKFVYKGSQLKEMFLDTSPCFITDRLIIRPWYIEDAEDLFKYASEEKIGLACGFKPHKSIEDSIEVIENILIRPGQYAIIHKKTNEAIGCIGIYPRTGKDEDGNDIEEAEIGYWIGSPFWGRGLVVEALKPIIEFSFNELKLNRLYISYDEGNIASKRVTEKLGFKYVKRLENVFVEPLNVYRNREVTVLINNEKNYRPKIH